MKQSIFSGMNGYHNDTTIMSVCLSDFLSVLVFVCLSMHIISAMMLLCVCQTRRKTPMQPAAATPRSLTFIFMIYPPTQRLLSSYILLKCNPVQTPIKDVYCINLKFLFVTYQKTFRVTEKHRIHCRWHAENLT
jgi:hypothetical protein